MTIFDCQSEFRLTAIVMGRGFVSLLAVVVITAACGQAETAAQTSVPPSSSSASPSAAQSAAASSGPITIEFDVPEEFGTQVASSPDAVTGFRVGFFRANNLTAIRTVDFARNAVTVRDRTARVTVSGENVPSASTMRSSGCRRSHAEEPAPGAILCRSRSSA